MRPHLVAVAALVLLAGCGSSSDRSAPPSPTPSVTPSVTASAAAPGPPSAAPSPTPSWALRVVPLEADGSTQTGFRSPSGNVVCALTVESGAQSWVRCDVTRHTWTLPPKPADCDLDWGSVATVTDSGKPATMGACVSDPAWTGTEQLGYGHALRLGELECRSSTTGVECVTGSHGFVVSRGSYRVW